MTSIRDSRLDPLLRWQAREVLRPLDVELGRLLLELDPAADAALGMAAAGASAALSEGHSCLELARLPELLGASADELPERGELLAILRGSRVVGRPGDGEPRPLILDAAERLYLRRYYRYEEQVARALLERLAAPVEAADPERLRTVLGRHFKLDQAVPDWQAVAVLAGLQARLTVITGGPGTGKTTTVLWLMAAMVELAIEAGREPPRIALAAPTGKAAARMADALRAGLARLEGGDAVRAAIPDSAATLHRLLGTIPGRSRFRHHAANPLDADVLIVDEASMVDLPLMARLLDALDEKATLVLLGDRNQLASVEAGNVLAAICKAADAGGVSPPRAALIERVLGVTVPGDAQATAFADQVVELRRSWRFGEHSGLGQLARQVLAGDADGVVGGLHEGRFEGVSWRESADPSRSLVADFGEHFTRLGSVASPEAALARVSEQGLLTALREGKHGCDAINAAMDHQLGLRHGHGAGQAMYPGRLLLIRQNDYANALFNGDIGIVWRDARSRLSACFPQADGVRWLPLASLPAHASAWAMTIHKSQGSEYDRVTIVLPAVDARVLSRELLYTAITRARREVTLVAGETVLRQAIGRSTRRDSGLADMLRRG